MTDQGTALKKRSADALTPGVEADRVRSAMEQLKAMRQFVAGEMVDGMDFGTIPGTGPKSVLLLPGAQKVVMYYNACPDYQIATAELGEGHVEYLITTKLLSRGNGSIVGAGVGSCSTMESKYRFRTRGRTCPQCGIEAIITGKAEYGGGFLCFKKKGGCGAKFREDDQAITSQQAGQTENENIYDVRNTVLKMAKKRALVDAAIGLGCLAELFTQDLDDFQGFPGQDTTVTVEPVPTRQEQPARAEKPAVPEAHPLAQILGERVKALTETTGETKEGIVSRVCDIEGLRRNGRIDFSRFTEEDYRRLITRVEREIESVRAELAASEAEDSIAQALPF